MRFMVVSPAQLCAAPLVVLHKTQSVSWSTFDILSVVVGYAASGFKCVPPWGVENHILAIPCLS
jgi:hypothetical protein